MPRYEDFTKLDNATGPLPDLRAVEFRVGEDDDGATVGTVLRRRLLMSRRCVNHAKYLANGIMVDGQRVRTNAVVHEGQCIRVVVGDEPSLVESSSVQAVEAAPGMLNIVYEDEDILVIDKPAGLTMHPARGYENASLSNYLMAYLEAQGRPARAHIVNRLDKGTSGLMVCATNAHAKWLLQRTLHGGDNGFDGRAFTRTYLAFCHGAFEQEHGLIDAPMARIMQTPCIMAVAEGPEWSRPDKPAVFEARTHFEVVAQSTGGSEVALVRFVLDTGRTHQIRVHASHIGHPLLGDTLYGGTTELTARPALHSTQLDFTHPLTREELHFESPLPQDMADVAAACHIEV